MSRKWHEKIFSRCRLFLGSGGQNDSNTHTVRCESPARKNFFMNSTYFMSRKWQSFVFGLNGGQNDSNTHTSGSLEPAENEKFFMNSTHTCSSLVKARNQTFLGSWTRRNDFMSRHPSVLASQREKIVFGLRRGGSRLFLGSGGRNDSNTHQFARIGEKKNFHELYVYHV